MLFVSHLPLRALLLTTLQAELSQARTQIEELEEQNRQLQDAREESDSTLTQLRTENAQQAHEIESLRSRTTLSQANWVKERDELIMREAQAREKFEEARQAMQDWEVLAMEERSQRENLSDRVAELEEQSIAQKEAYERAAGERDSQSQTVDGLQRALRDIQDGQFAIVSR
jgi:chromosome segregation ATPase